MTLRDANDNFAAMIKKEIGAWPDGSKLVVVTDQSKQPDSERDHYICTLTDPKGFVLGQWAGMEKQKMYSPFPEFSVSRLAD